MELTVTQMFGITLLIFGAIGLARVVRYFTIEEVEKSQLKKQVEELSAKVEALSSGNGRLPAHLIEPTEEVLFLGVRTRDHIYTAIEHLTSALKANEVVVDNATEMRGLDKDYKNGPRSK